MPDVAYQALAELWEAVFGEQPSVVAEPSLTAQVLVAYLPPVEPYSFGAEDDPED
ncbi:hypothetical protein [Caulobacter soli]|uniref:hypothetical protein n=1 Tax=Caulobacter soli TaxID=2708539 RepID=UPI0013E9CBF2|nr:hypothetical protein [Caulobacter soli]